MGTGLMPLLRKRCFPLYFARRVLDEYQVETRALLELARTHRLEKLSKSHFPSSPRDTAFILGTGSSINDYTEDHWRHVASGYSIGVNFWLLHEFVPDACSLEIDNQQTEESQLTREVQLQLLKIREEDYRQVLLLTRGSGQFNYLRETGIPPQYENRLKLAISLRLQGDTLEEKTRYTRLYGHLLRISRRLPWLNGFITPGITASILFLTVLCYELGFQKVVLCGVDLNHAHHFYERPLKNSRMLREGWPAPPTELTQEEFEVHPTFDREWDYLGGFNVKDHLLMLQEQTFQKDGFRIYSGSPRSALVPEIPPYDWPS